MNPIQLKSALLPAVLCMALTSTKAQNICNNNNLWVNGTFENTVTGSHCNIFNPINAYQTQAPFLGFTTFILTAGNAIQPAYVNEATIDHTTGAAGGHYLYMDPRTGSGVISQVKQSIKVKAGNTYTFSAWFCSMLSSSYASAPATVQLYVNGVAASSTKILDGTSVNNWQLLSGIWTATITGSVNADIVNISPSVGGHDFAIDDISFGAGSMEVDAGRDATICIEQQHQLGGTPTAALGATCNDEYKYDWWPLTGFTSASNIANPTLRLTTPGVYTYTVTVTDLNGNICSDQVTVAVDACDGTAVNNLSGSAVRIFPNPTSRLLTFSELPVGVVDIHLYTVGGQKILNGTTKTGSLTIDLSPFASGIYYYVISDSRGNVIGRNKVVKQ